jgi:hypothetical protein
MMSKHQLIRDILYYVEKHRQGKSMTIQNADPDTRKKAIRGLVLALFIGCVLFGWLHTYQLYVYSLLSQLGLAVIQTPILILFVVGGLTLPLHCLLWPLFKLSRRIIRHERYPPPHTLTFRNVNLVEGKAAVIRGKMLFLLLSVMSALLTALPFYSWYIVLKALGRV